MKAIKITESNGKLNSWYHLCRNTNGKYQFVAIPYNRIDEREYNTKEEAIAALQSIVNYRSAIVEECNLMIQEVNIK